MNCRYIATLCLALLVLPQPAHAFDCDDFVTSMNTLSYKLDSITVNDGNDSSLIDLVDTICSQSNMNALSNCDTKQIQLFAAPDKEIQTKEAFQKQFTKMCSHKEEFIEAQYCVTKDSVKNATSYCSESIPPASKDLYGKSQLEIVCWGMRLMFDCIESGMKGRCAEKTVEYQKSALEEHYAATCSSATIVANIVLFWLAILLHFV